MIVVSQLGRRPTMSMMARTGAIAMIAIATASGGVVAQTAAPAMSSRFVTDQARSEFRASKFAGIDVYGSDGQKIGDIADILMDVLGNAQTVVIGVGGFLGIGEKTIAVPFTSLEWVMTRPSRSAAAQPTSGGTAGTTTGAVVTETTMPPRSPEEEAAYNGHPDRAIVKLLRADLQTAPTFKYYAQTHPAPGTGSDAPTSPPVRP